MKLLPELFVYVLVLTYFKGCEGNLGGNPLERNVSNCTHIVVSLLKAWNVTVVWIVCDDAFFNPQKNLNSASKVANWIIVDILKYLY